MFLQLPKMASNEPNPARVGSSMQKLFRVLVASIALAALPGAALQPSFVDLSREELIKAAPELSGVQFDSDQSTLEPLLGATGQQLESMLAKFINVSIAEDVHEMRFDSKPLLWKDHRDKFQYVVETRPFAESRRPVPNSSNGFAIAGHFIDLLGDFLPQNQKQLRFRYLGSFMEGGAGRFVVAFAARDGARQGLLWVDETTKTIARLRMDDRFTRNVRFIPVTFSGPAVTLWLPSSATVNLRLATGELHSVHRFSDYHLEGSEKNIGAAAKPPLEEDAIEVLMDGVLALEAGTPADAIGPLREATRRLRDRFEPGYYLGLALYGAHDLAGAETQFREAVQRSPNMAAAHNELGAVLFERGDRAGAVTEFQEALRLEPGNRKMLANLDEAKLAPEAKASATTGDLTVRVDVRQVLVPVVVTNQEGRHITGLTAADFKVFEDGAEQKIIAFSSERSDLTSPVAPSRANSVAAANSPKPGAARRTYIICLDLLHTSFSNFVHVREAMQKLFREERPGDSQYLVIALGRTIQVVQNTTPDPAKVLEALNGAEFKKISEQSMQGSSQSEISQFEGKLQDVRSACDVGDIACGMEKPTLPRDAQMLADHERYRTMQFASEFRAVVQQVASGNGRRTLVLISDGFPLAPGAVPYGLLQAYFSEFHSGKTVEADQLQNVLEPIFRLAAKANVPVYTIDSRGLYTQSAFDAAHTVNLTVATQVTTAMNNIAVDQGQTLSEIAAATGGKAFQNSNDLAAGMKKALTDGREYYMLAYVPSNEAQDGKFRKIEVKVRDTNATVSAKRGYWASSQ
jgi:VWFA-related protein